MSAPVSTVSYSPTHSNLVGSYLSLGAGRPAHFFHANGYPPAAYLPLLTELASTHQLTALSMRPCWTPTPAPPRSFRWKHYGDDLAQFLQQTQQPPVIGVGHSMGAVATLYAAVKHPELFTSLVLIEPASAPWWFAWSQSLLPFSVRRRLQPAKGTARRTHRWKSRGDFERSCRRSPFLRGFSEESLAAIVASCVREDGDEVTLTFPRDWEAHNFMVPPAISKQIQRVQVPTTVIVGASSFYFRASLRERWKSLRPDHPFISLDGGHLLPLSHPQATAQAVQKATTP